MSEIRVDPFVGYKRLRVVNTSDDVIGDNISFKSGPGHGVIYGQDATAVCSSTGAHRSPQKGCRCGWNACDTPIALIDQVSAWKPDEYEFVAKVFLFGHYIRHDNGVTRGERQRVTELYAHPTCRYCKTNPATSIIVGHGCVSSCDTCPPRKTRQRMTVHEFSEWAGLPVSFAPTEWIGPEPEGDLKVTDSGYSITLTVFMFVCTILFYFALFSGIALLVNGSVWSALPGILLVPLFALAMKTQSLTVKRDGVVAQIIVNVATVIGSVTIFLTVNSSIHPMSYGPIVDAVNETSDGVVQTNELFQHFAREATYPVAMRDNDLYVWYEYSKCVELSDGSTIQSSDDVTTVDLSRDECLTGT